MSNLNHQERMLVTQASHQFEQAKGLIKKAKEVKELDPLLRLRLAYEHLDVALKLLCEIKCEVLDEVDDNKVSVLVTKLKSIELVINQKPHQEILDAIAQLEV